MVLSELVIEPLGDEALLEELLSLWAGFEAYSLTLLPTSLSAFCVQQRCDLLASCC